jgi:hypothetical protein
MEVEAVMQCEGAETLCGLLRIPSGRMRGFSGKPGNPGFEFTELSLVLHSSTTMSGESFPAMNDNIVIPKVKIEQLKLWLGRALKAATWLICLGLLGLSAAVAGFGALAWLISGSETVLAVGLGGGALIGLAGVWQLLHRLDQAAKELRPATSVS